MSGETTKKSGLYRFLDWVERVGNKLPSPFTLFLMLLVITMVISLILSMMGVSVTYQTTSEGQLVDKTVAVTNLFSPAVIKDLLTGLTRIYVNFAPLGLVLVMMMSIGLIEQTGLISAVMRKAVMGVKPVFVTAVLAFVGINANLASDVGMIFSAAIGGALYKSLGRNPKLGIIVGFSAASGGFTANLLLAGTDALLAGIAETVVKGTGIDAPVHPAMNWYFMVVATFVLTLVTVLVAEKITAKSLEGDVIEQDANALKEHALKPEELKGLRYAGIAALIYLAILLFCTVPKSGFLRSDAGTLLPSSPFLSGIIAIIFLFFCATGISYGIGAGVIKKESDVPKLMQKSLQNSVSFMVVALSAAIFIEMFNKSGLTTIIAVNGANFLESLNMPMIVLLILFIFLTTFINLFTISGSAKWLLLAPIFIPMFMRLGISPALTQTAYRIGDSCTNIISPLSPYIPVIIGIFDQYKRESDPPAGIGTVISFCLPYSVAYLIALIIQLAIFVLLGLAVGPGAPIRL